MSNWAAGLVPALGLEGVRGERGMEALPACTHVGDVGAGGHRQRLRVQSLGTYCVSWFYRLRGSGHGRGRGLGWVGVRLFPVA